MNPIHEAALKHCKLNHSIIPLKPHDKKPLIDWRDFQNRRATEAEINAWFRMWPDANIGLVTGRISNVVAVDVDGPGGAAWADANFSKMAIQTTGKDHGYHILFSLDGVPMKNGVKVRPEIDTRGEGGYIVLAPSIHPSGRQYGLHFADGVDWGSLPSWTGFPDSKTGEVSVPTRPDQEGVEGISSYVLAALQRELGYVAHAPEGQRNNTLNKAAYSLGQFVGGGELDQAYVETALLESARASGLDDQESQASIRSGLKSGKGSPRNSPAQETNGSIVIREDNLAEVADRCEEIITNPKLPPESRVYQSGGRLVRTGTLPVADFGMDPAAPRYSATILEVDRPYILDLLSRHGRFTRFDKRSGKMKACNPPREVAEIILARKGFWKAPVLRGVLNGPTLRADGSVVHSPGYDQSSGYFLAHDLSISIPEMPTKEEVQTAINDLQGLLSGFCFVDEEDRSVAMSLLITAVIRAGMDRAPLVAISATTRGSGKSTLSDIASAISQGRKSAVLSATGDQEELEKRLAGSLMGGDPMVNLDNINGTLESDLLCQALTSEALRLRPLGGSAQIEIPNTAVFCANGNNLIIGGDLARRTLLCRLDPGVERPEERTFLFDPVERVLGNRAKFVGAVLTICRGYLAAGQPDMNLTPFGSFERWSALVRAPLVWGGMIDPCKSRAAVIDEDPEAQQLRELLSEWHKVFGRKPQSVKEVLKVANRDPDGPLYEILDSIAGEHAGISAKKLGHWLKRQLGRVSGGLKLTRPKVTRCASWSAIPA